MKLSLSIKGRLLLFALCISLIPIAVITTVYYFNAHNALKHQVKENLRSLAELKKQHILYFLEVAKVRTVDFSTDEFMRDSLEAIVHGSNVKSEVTLRLNEHLVSMNKMSFHRHIMASFFVDKRGKIVSSTNEKMMDMDLSGEDIFTQGMAKSYEEVYVSQPVCFPKIGAYCICVSTPVFSQQKSEPLGVIIVVYNLSALSEITTARIGTGKTDEIYLVNKDKIMLTESRFITNAPLTQVVDTEPVRSMLEGGAEAVGVYQNCRGVPVVGAAVNIPEYGWILLAEIDEAEACESLRKLSIIAFALGIVSASAVTILGIFFAVSTSRPIKELTDATARIANGDLDYKVKISRKDEIGMLASSFNVMTRKLAGEIIERRLAEESQKRFVDILEETTDLVGVANKSGQVLYLNRAGRKMAGIGIDEDVSKTTIMQYHSDWIGSMIRDVGLPAAMRGGTWNGETALLSRDGREIPVSQEIIAHKLPNGEIEFISTIMRDLTESRRNTEEKTKLREQLCHIQRLESIGKLAGGVAHNFNNLLMVITGYGSLLQMEIEKNATLNGYVRKILDAVEQGAHLTQDLLAFSRKQTHLPQFVALNEIVKRSESLLLKLVDKDIELKTLLADKDITLLADSLQIEQVLMNLVTNAKDAMPDGGVITITTGFAKTDDEFLRLQSTGKGEKYALISVTDTGTGMDEKTKERIFEPFFTTKEVDKGTGLGLAVVYGIIKQHEGFIDVESTPGSGTVFRIYLPIQEAKTEEKKPEELPTPVGGTETILVAEDEDWVRMLVKTVLERYGYTVIEAVDGADAVDKFRKNKDTIRLLISDVIMPKRHGRSVYDEIRKTRPDIKVIFMSGYPEDIISKKIIAEEGVAFISKPISPEKLLRKINLVLRNNDSTIT